LSLLFEVVLLLVEKASQFNLEGGNVLLSESGKKQHLFIYVLKKNSALQDCMQALASNHVAIDMILWIPIFNSIRFNDGKFL
jgi:hypothetical protein